MKPSVDRTSVELFRIGRLNLSTAGAAVGGAVVAMLVIASTVSASNSSANSVVVRNLVEPDETGESESPAAAPPLRCKRVVQMNCSEWWWREISGGIPPHYTCAEANPSFSCTPLILDDPIVNGWVYAATGYRKLQLLGPSPGSVVYRAPNGCEVQMPSGEWVCSYTDVVTSITCPNFVEPVEIFDCF